MVTLMAGDLASQTQGTALVEQRRDEMKQMGRAFKVFMPIIKGENANVADAVASAETVNANAKKLLANFPAGTGRDAVPETRAKPEVWSKRAEFEAANMKLVEESGLLVEAAKTNDIEVFRTQFKAFVTSCGGCHEGAGKAGGKFRYAKE
jgi:cytochrome c556